MNISILVKMQCNKYNLTINRGQCILHVPIYHLQFGSVPLGDGNRHYYFVFNHLCIYVVNAFLCSLDTVNKIHFITCNQKRDLV